MNLLSEIIYLDNAFIVDAYQHIQKEQAAVKYTKTTDVSLGINAIAKAGASLKESFEYPISAHSMYEKIESKLDSIETIALTDENIKNLPDLFWMEGMFGIMNATSNSNQPNAQTKYFYSAASKENKHFLCLSTNDVYFSSGYDQLLSQAEGFADHFVIEAKMLVKSLGTTRIFTVASPMVVKKIGNWNFE